MQLPDGRVQIVSYEADDYGFRPTVHYEYPNGEPSQESSALCRERDSLQFTQLGVSARAADGWCCLYSF